MTFLQSIAKKAKELNAKVLVGNVLDSEVTHIISPSNRRTIKTLIASLTCRWIVSPDWIIESEEYGQFLDEQKFVLLLYFLKN